MNDLKSLNLTELEEVIKKLELPKFRARQIYLWMLRGVNSFEEMTNLPKAVRDTLREHYYISFAAVYKKQVSKIDGTVKYLYKLYDGEFVESVVMKYKHGYSICVSTQVGCNMGCKFCASGIGGKTRDLTAGEILSQIHTASLDLNTRISNVVMMGIGEPLDNFENVLRFLRLVNEPEGLNIGMRHISLSTCGLVDRINELVAFKLGLTLSVSLHAATDDIRNKLMPINQKYNVEQVISACREYIRLTGRRVSFEYALIQGVNDSEECAEDLAKLLKGMTAHLNLIPANSIEHGGYRQPKSEKIRDFCEILSKNKINVTVRRTLGADIDASCGQLRKKVKD